MRARLASAAILLLLLLSAISPAVAMATPATITLNSAFQPAPAFSSTGNRLVDGFTLQRTAGTDAVSVSGIDFVDAGTDPTSTVSGVLVYRDNGDHGLGPGDTVLNAVLGPFEGTTATVTFDSPEPVGGTSVQYWVQYVFRPGAPNGATASCRVTDVHHDGATFVNNAVTGGLITLDTLGPDVAVTSPVSNAIVGDTSCTIAGTASDIAGVASVGVSIKRDGIWYWTGTGWGVLPVWVSVSGTTGWSCVWPLVPSEQRNAHTYEISARATDFIGNAQYSPWIGGITVDTVGPTGTVSINGGASHVGTRTVSLTMSASDDGTVSDMRFSEDGSTWSAWELYQTSRGFTLAAPGAAFKNVYVQFRDDAGTVSSSAVDTIILDPTPPVVTSFSASGGGYTCTTTVDFFMDGYDSYSGVSSMQFSADGISWDPPVSDGFQYRYDIASGDGTKTVFFRLIDGVGHVSEATSTEVYLDTVAPSGAIVTPEAGELLSGSVATITGTTSDIGAGASLVEVMILRSDGVYWTKYGWWDPTPTWNRVTPNPTWQYSFPIESGSYTYTLNALVYDKAGNSFGTNSVADVRSGITYSLTYATGGHGTITGSAVQTVAPNGSGSVVCAEADAGYHFVSWSDGVLTATRTDTNVTSDMSVTASFAPDTAPPHPLEVTASGGIHIDFGSVTNEGTTTVTPSSGQAAPANFRLLQGGYFEISTTASFTGDVTIKVPYDPGQVSGDPASLRLFHWENGAWRDITVSVDTVNHTVSGTTSSFSPFAIFEPLGDAPTVSTPASSGWSLPILGLGALVLVAMSRRRLAQDHAG